MTDKAIYRRSGMRVFLKVTESILIKVENKFDSSTILISACSMMLAET